MIIASGPVIIENHKVLVIKDSKDNFYKLPGGTLHNGEDLEQTCYRETKEEINGDIEIIKPLSPLVVYKNQQTGEVMTIVLIHYLAKLKNKDKIKPLNPVKEIKWLSVSDINSGKYKVGKNIEFLISKGDIK
ncbi:MAG: NUDIX hydrolase [Candidatus Pacearchaeota archaeon]